MALRKHAINTQTGLKCSSCKKLINIAYVDKEGNSLCKECQAKKETTNAANTI
jgi:hypothetical protein